MENETKSTSSFVNETIVLALIPFVGYVSCYAYEWAIAWMWGIPKYLIKIDLGALGNTMTFFLIASVPIVFLNYFKKYFIDSSGWIKSKPIISVVLKVVILLLSLLAILYFLQIESFHFDVIIGLVVIYSVIQILGWYFADNVSYRMVGLFIIKIRKLVDGKLFKEQFGERAALFIIVILLFPVLSFIQGYSFARTNRLFLCPPGNENYVVLRKYDETFICRSFDKEKHIFKDSLLFIQVSPEKGLVYPMIELGPIWSRTEN